MKRKLLSVSLIALSVLAFSCKKDELNSTPGLNEISALDTRGGGGGVDDACQNPLPPGPLIIEKNGSNNNYDELEGEVIVSNDLDSVYVTYNCLPDFGIKNVQIWVGPKALAPVNATGNPTFGSFQTKRFGLRNAPTYKVGVARTAITLGPDMVVIAHANVFGHNNESSYGKGPFFVPGGKAMYMAYTPCGWSTPGSSN